MSHKFQLNTRNLLKGFKKFGISHFMIRVTAEKSKDKYEIIAIASHQRDLNNLRLMSYRLFDGKDKIQLNKDKYGGPYIKIKCDQFMLAGDEVSYDIAAMNTYISQLQSDYN